MKRKIVNLNLAELTEGELIQTLEDNEAGVEELFLLLEALFEMWAAALKFSSTVSKYGQQHHEDFMENFIRHAVPQHGISPQRLATLLRMIGKQPAASNALH